MRTGTILGALVGLALGSLAAGGVARAQHPGHPAQPAVQEVRCPVTGEVVKDPASAAKSEYKGRTYYFCCPACKPKFDADPEKYTVKAAGEKAPELPRDEHSGAGHHHGHHRMH